MNVTVYGPDGATLLETLEDHGDGTGTRTLYAPDGTPSSTEAVTGLPVETPPATDPLHALARAIVAAETLDDVKPTAIAILTDGDV